MEVTWCQELGTWHDSDSGQWEHGSLKDRRAERSGGIAGKSEKGMREVFALKTQVIFS